MSSGARPEPDEADPTVARVPPQRPGPDDAVTEIMPVIAPWPAAGEAPPAPPASWFAPAESPIRGVATVDLAAADPDQAVAGGPVAGEAVVGEAVVGEVVEDRTGPVALERDTWDTATLATPADLRRRVDAPSTKVWVAVGAALAALIAAIALPFVYSSDDEDVRAPAAAGLPTALDEPTRISAESAGAGPTPIATAAAAAPSPSAIAPAQPGAQITTGGAVPGPPAPATSTTAANPPAAPPFSPLNFEAEDGTRTGSATIWDGYPSASGGRLVRNIGNWGGTAGTLRINNVNIPTTGSYTVTIYYVHPDGEANRSATVTVSGNPALNVNFTGNANCCQTKVLSNITLSAGAHTITFANPTGHAPSVDRIVISRP